MSSVKLVIQNKKKVYRQNTIAVSIRITHDRRNYYKTLCRVPADMFDEARQEIRRQHEDAVKLNKILWKWISDAKNYLLDAEIKSTPVDPVRFFKSGHADDDIISLIQAKVYDLRQDAKFRTAEKYDLLMRRIVTFKLNRKLHQVNSQWIKEFDRGLKEQGNRANTRGKMIAAVGSVFRQAKRDGYITVNPFEDYRKPSEDTSKHKLSIGEFHRLRSADLSGPAATARDLFVFATLCRGMRPHDVLTLRWESIHADRLRYRAQKTGKKFDLKITDEMIAFLQGLDRGSMYVFPFVKLPPDMYKSDKDRYEKHVNSVNTAVNKVISRIVLDIGIQKHITLHCARHTFSAIGGMKGIALPVMQQLLGHAKMETTAKYMRQVFKNDDLDDAVEGLF